MSSKSTNAFINYLKMKKSGELAVIKIEEDDIPADFSKSIKNYDLNCKDKINRYQSLMRYIKNKNK